MSTAPARVVPGPPGSTRAQVLAVLRAERRKLLAQLSTRLVALVCVFGPLAFAVVLREQSGVPADTLLGVWVHSSGDAVSFVVLGFAGYLGFPVLAGAVAGDLFAAEDRYGTWKTLLTRSCSRRAVFTGKVLAVMGLAVAMTALAAAASIVSGLAVIGSGTFVGLGGNGLSGGEAVWLALLSWLFSMLPVLGFVSLAVLFSVSFRNGIAGVLGPILVALVMQLLGLIGRGSVVHTLLLGSAFDGWHGLLAAPRFYAPLLYAALVSLAWIAACLGGAWLLLRSRDFAGPPVARRPGWVVPVWVVAGALALTLALGAATNLGPVPVTEARVEASVAKVFDAMTIRQQRELGRQVPRGAHLQLRTLCSRRSGPSRGPGDDWSCTLSVLTPTPGIEPFRLTAVTYEMSVRSNGCYKADAPPSFVGQQTMTDAHGAHVVNPLFTLYGCFDTSAAPPASRHAPGGETAPARKHPARSPGARREAERKALREAEKAAGPKVIKEIEETEKSQQRATERPSEEEELEAPVK